MPCAEWYTSVDSRRLSTVECKSKAFLAVDSGACITTSARCDSPRPTRGPPSPSPWPCARGPLRLRRRAWGPGRATPGPSWRPPPPSCSTALECPRTPSRASRPPPPPRACWSRW
eukprot:710926-Prorocentrum_minimum.AAC.1